ncbi:hypothetical protein C8R42DRAFT_420634 [Lentinula raphanica]|nr:hypothetical protein C8R42DRAFT_420634 [Lentinula raphanica]
MTGLTANLRANANDDDDDLEITITLGILPSGASVLLLTPAQVEQIYLHVPGVRFPHPNEAYPSSTFESLSPIELDTESLTAKLRALAPKAVKKGRQASDRDTSQANKGFCQRADLNEGAKRGLFENARLLRQLAMKRILPPSTSLETLIPGIHEAYAQFSAPHNFHEKILPRIHVAAFAYTLWAADTRYITDRRRSPDLLDVAWTKALDGIRDLRVPPAGHPSWQQMVFGWNAFKNQPRMSRKAFPGSKVQQEKDSKMGVSILRELLEPCLSSSLSNSMPVGPSANADSNAEHLILLVYNETTVRDIFLAYGVDLLAGNYDPSAESSGMDGDAGWARTKWKWINDQGAGLKDLVRDDSYGNLDRSDIPSSSRTRRDTFHNVYNHNHNGHSSSSTAAYSSPYDNQRHTRYVRDSDIKPDIRDRTRRSSYSSDHESNDRSDYMGDGRGKRALDIKREHLDHEYRQFKRLKRESTYDLSPKRENDRDGTVLEEDVIVKSEPYQGYFIKKEENGVQVKDESRGSYTFDKIKDRTLSPPASTALESTQPPSPSPSLPPPEIHIHVLDIKRLFHSSTGADIGAHSVQAMARELSSGGMGGVSLYGTLEENEYSSGWDAALMLSIFQLLTDGRTVDEQRATAASRREVQMAEESVLQEKNRAERERMQSIRPSLDDDVDPNDFVSQAPREDSNWLGEEWSDNGESE